MKFFLDTNICIYVINQRPPHVIERFRQHRPPDLGVSAVTVSELYYGAAKSSRPQKNKEVLTKFLTPLSVAEYDLEASRMYGDLRADLERRGMTIGPLDLMIAAQAVALGIPVVTNNVREFERIEDLVVVNWMD